MNTQRCPICGEQGFSVSRNTGSVQRCFKGHMFSQRCSKPSGIGLGYCDKKTDHEGPHHWMPTEEQSSEDGSTSVGDGYFDPDKVSVRIGEQDYGVMDVEEAVAAYFAGREPVRVPGTGLHDARLAAMAKEAISPDDPVGGFFVAYPRSGKWRSVRDAFVKANPTCAGCGDTRMLNVHHKLPLHLFPALELEPVNLIVLCEVPSHACHFALGHCFDWRAYNPYVAEDAAARLKRVADRVY